MKTKDQNKKINDIPLFEENAVMLKQIAEADAGLALLGSLSERANASTANAMIDYLNNVLDKNVVIINTSIEDHQFEKLLQDSPDVIVINETDEKITDEERKGIFKQAIHASNAECLVISTIFSKNNLDNIRRLIDFGIGFDMIKESTVALVNQRSVMYKSEEKALMEIAMGEDLEELMSGLSIEPGDVSSVRYIDYYINYLTIEDEYLLLKELEKDSTTEQETEIIEEWIEVTLNDDTGSNNERTSNKDLNKSKGLELD